MKSQRLSAVLSLIVHGCVGLAASAQDAMPTPRTPTASHDLYGVHYDRMAFRSDGQTVYRVEAIQAINVWEVLVYFWPEILGTIAGLSLLLGVGFWFRRRRVGNHPVGTPYCRKCRYSLQGSAAADCPECGADRKRYQRVYRRLPKRWAWMIYGLLALPMVGYGGLHVQEVSRLSAAGDWLEWDSEWLFTLDVGPLDAKEWIWQDRTPRTVTHYAVVEFDVASPYPRLRTLINTGRQSVSIGYDAVSDQFAVLCDRDMHLWDCASRQWIGHLTRPGEPDRRSYHHLKWWPGPQGEQRLMTFDGDRHYWIWDFSTGHVERTHFEGIEPLYYRDGLRPIGHGPIYEDSDWIIPEGHSAFEATGYRYWGYNRDTDRAWTFSTLSKSWRAYSSDGRQLYLGDNLATGRGQIQAWDFLAGEKTWEIDLPAGVRIYNSMRVALEDRWLLVHVYGRDVGWAGDLRQVWALDVESRRWVAVFEIEGLKHSPTFWVTPDLQTLVAHPRMGSDAHPFHFQQFDIGDLTNPSP
ncbi:MAG: hypothetical protein AAF086_07330 [Planctomycetota bacterium]